MWGWKGTLKMIKLQYEEVESYFFKLCNIEEKQD